MYSWLRLIKQGAVLALTLVLVSTVAFAQQSANGTLRGRIADQFGLNREERDKLLPSGRQRLDRREGGDILGGWSARRPRELGGGWRWRNARRGWETLAPTSTFISTWLRGRRRRGPTCASSPS